MMVPFSAYVAVDWSGATGRFHKGLAVAVAKPGAAAPLLVSPASPRGWERGEVAQWLLAQPGRLLVGFDFSFAPPFVERGAYLPGLDTPETGPAFWAWMDAQCTDAHLGAADFMAGAARPHFWMGAADGRKADFLHHRVCEVRYNAGGGGKASTVFDCVGAAQVAKASFSGMRVLHRLRGHFAVWPFDAADDGRSVVVEIYTRAMLQLAGGRGAKVRDMAALDAALAEFGSEAFGEGSGGRSPLSPGQRTLTDHETDVVVAAAGLRALAGEARLWSPQGMTAAIARTEGWTFGIR